MVFKCRYRRVITDSITGNELREGESSLTRKFSKREWICSELRSDSIYVVIRSTDWPSQKARLALSKTDLPHPTPPSKKEGYYLQVALRLRGPGQVMNVAPHLRYRLVVAFFRVTCLSLFPFLGLYPCLSPDHGLCVLGTSLFLSAPSETSLGAVTGSRLLDSIARPTRRATPNCRSAAKIRAAISHCVTFIRFDSRHNPLKTITSSSEVDPTKYNFNLCIADLTLSVQQTLDFLHTQ